MSIIECGMYIMYRKANQLHAELEMHMNAGCFCLFLTFSVFNLECNSVNIATIQPI